MVASSGSPEIVASVSWGGTAVGTFGLCDGLPYQGRIVYGNGTIVLAGNSGVISRSTDSGQNWSSPTIADSLQPTIRGTRRMRGPTLRVDLVRSYLSTCSEPR